MQPKLVVHGGAWDWSDEQDAPKSEALVRALEVGQKILMDGGHALDVVEKAVNVLEDEPLFDAGIGSHLNADGMVEMDALIIDGTVRDFGAVAGVQRVRYPISLARRVLDDTPHRLFVGTGADMLAQQLGIPLVPNISLVTPAELDAYRRKQTMSGHDTVGAVALDAQGNIAVATSTGGTPLKMAGRVGDSPLFGAGGYADSRYGGSGATGKGENSMRMLLTKSVVDLLAQGKDAQEASQIVIEEAERFISESMVAVITIDSAGRLGASHSTPKLACGWLDEAGEMKTSMCGGIL